MLLGVSKAKNLDIYKTRRQLLLGKIKEKFNKTDGLVLLCAGYEHHKTLFRQESSFYYLSGITEPGAVLTVEMSGQSTLSIPNFGKERSKWIANSLESNPETAKKLGVDIIKYLGDRAQGYQLYPYANQSEYALLIETLKKHVQASKPIFTLYPATYHNFEQKFLIDRLKQFIPELGSYIHDISDLVADLRRKKDMDEIEHLYRAVEVTILAQESAAQAIEDNVTEHEVQASIEYMFVGSGAQPAFPSIVASGKNGTILHYNENKDTCKNGDLVVVDIGAELNYYCADLTRTYPVSGSFTARQKELYNIVLDAQEYIADSAKPGMWLSNAQYPDQSLHHMAVKFFKKYGYDKYFTHGIGHFIGLDVHDVGDRNKPLREGDVFTIEPGLYIPEEGIGIRIEDNYWMVKEHTICLSESLARKPADIEDLMQKEKNEEPEQEYEDIETEFDEDDDELELAHS